MFFCVFLSHLLNLFCFCYVLYNFYPFSCPSLYEMLSWYLQFSWRDLWSFPFYCFPVFFFNCSFKKAFLSLFSMKWDFMEQQNTRQLFKCTFWKILVIYYYLNGNLFILNAAVAAKLLQLCPTLGDHIDSSPQSSSVPGILQARILEWVAISFSNEWKWKMKVKLLSCFQLFSTPWTVAYQTPPSMGFSRQEY